MAQMVNSPPTMQETWVQSLSHEDPLQDSKAIYSSILAWRIPWTKEEILDWTEQATVHGITKELDMA